MSREASRREIACRDTAFPSQDQLYPDRGSGCGETMSVLFNAPEKELP